MFSDQPAIAATTQPDMRAPHTMSSNVADSCEATSRWFARPRAAKIVWHEAQPPSTEEDSIFGGEFMDVLYRHRRVPALQLPFSWRDRVVRRGKCRCHHKVLEPGRREYEEIVIRSGAGVP